MSKELLAGIFVAVAVGVAIMLARIESRPTQIVVAISFVLFAVVYAIFYRLKT